MDLGSKFKDIRYSYNINQERMAKILNINRNYLSRIETNKSYPTAEILIKLAKEFSISIDSLLDIKFIDEDIKEKRIKIKKINSYFTNLNNNELDFIIKLLRVISNNKFN